MILAVDIGNSSVIIGYADDNSQQIIGRLAAARHKTEDEYAVDLLRLMELSGLQPADIKGAIVASVVPSVKSLVKSRCWSDQGSKPA